MFSPNLRDRGVDVAVLAGIAKVVVVGGATDASANVIKEDEGQLFEDHLRSQRGGKTLSRNIVAQVRWRPTLILVVARKGVTQIQDGGGIQGQVIRDENIAPVSGVLGIVGVPSAGENVGGGED